jgi:biogenesis of lysosome-related organelles complex 1 subunit 4
MIMISNIFQITPILSTAETIQTRINEIESIFLPTIKHDAEVAHENISQVLQHKEQFDKICDQIDNLESLVQRVKSDLVKIEKQVEIANEELDIPEKKIDIFLKSINIFARPRDPRETNWTEDGQYIPPEVFSSKDYFSSDAGTSKSQ